MNKMEKNNGPDMPNLLTLGALFFSFSITVFAQQSGTQSTKNIAYAYLVGSAILVILAILPKKFSMSIITKTVRIVVSLLALLAWFIVFAMKWLDGIKNTQNTEQLLISWVGIAFLFAIFLIETRMLKGLTKRRELGLVMPLALTIYGVKTSVIDKFDWLACLILFVFVAASLVVVFSAWEPGEDMPFIS